jgi:MFS family permease
MRLVLLALTTFVLFLSTLVGTPAIPELAARLGADAGATAATLSSAMMTLVLLQFFTGGLADRYGRRLVLGGAALAGGLTSLGCAAAGNWRWLLAMRVLGGVADAVSMPALLGLTAEISEGRQGAFFGALRSAQGLSFILGPAIGGALSFVSLRMPFLADAVLSLAACALLVRFVPAQATHPGERHDWAQLRRLKAMFADRRFYAFALFCGVNNVAFPVLSAFGPGGGLLFARLLVGGPSVRPLGAASLCHRGATWGDLVLRRTGLGAKLAVAGGLVRALWPGWWHNVPAGAAHGRRRDAGSRCRWHAGRFRCAGRPADIRRSSAGAGRPSAVGPHGPAAPGSRPAGAAGPASRPGRPRNQETRLSAALRRLDVQRGSLTEPLPVGGQQD